MHSRWRRLHRAGFRLRPLRLRSYGSDAHGKRAQESPALVAEQGVARRRRAAHPSGSDACLDGIGFGQITPALRA